jgi:hypothetical protein
MAKELGLNPRTLIKNGPSRAEPWKTLLEQRVRDVYSKRRTG